MSFITTEEISKEDIDDLVKRTSYCCIKANGFDFIKVGTLSGNGIAFDELDTPYQYFSIWSSNFIYSSPWVDKLNDWGI